MADTKISALTELAEQPASNDVLAIVDTSVTTTKKITPSNLTTGLNKQVSYTVGATNADYITDGTADEVQINQAIAAANTAGGGVVILKPGTYTIADPVQIKSSVTLRGSGIGVTTIKAVNSYAPSTLNFAGGRSVIIDFGQSNGGEASGGVTNIVVEGITFDHNVANSGVGTGTSIHRTVYIRNSNDVYFINNEIKNFVSWASDFDHCARVWIQNNKVITDGASTLTNHDGIHVSDSTDFFITGNYIDTLNGGTAGDDAIAVQQYTDTHPVRNGVISGNTVTGSGSRGIVLLTRNELMENIVISGNVVRNTYSSGIKLYTVAGDGTTGKFYGITIADNNLYDIRQSGGEASAGIQLLPDVDAARVMYENISITGNVIRTVNEADSKGIAVTGKTIGLVVTGNRISGMAGTHGIHLGGSSNPIKDYVLSNNNIDVSGGASGIIGILLYGTEGGSCTGNTIAGNVTGTTYGILLQAKATAGNDAQGVANAETSAYNNVSDNQMYNFDNGIVEANDGANPDNNQYIANIFNTITTRLTLLGLNSKSFNHVSSSVALAMGSPSDALISQSSRGFMSSNAGGVIQVMAENTGVSGPSAGTGGGFYSNDGAAMASGDRLGFFLFGGSSSATALRNTVLVGAYASEAWTDGVAYGTELRFETTANGGTTRSEKLRITHDGRLYGTALHNNAGSVTGTTTQYIGSGTYTPTLTNVANVDASTPYACQWMRVGNVVTVSGKVDIDATTTLTLTQVGVSLPIASALTAANQCAGTANAGSVTGSNAAILGDATNDRAEIDFVPSDTANDSLYFTFTYVVV